MTILINEQGDKRCSKCHIYKPPNEFHRDRSRKIGLESSCRQCNGHHKRVSPWDGKGNKVCPGCWELKPKSDYPKDNKTGGIRSQCKRCKKKADNLRMKRKARTGLSERECVVCREKKASLDFKVNKGTQWPWCLECGDDPRTPDRLESLISINPEVDMFIARVMLRSMATGAKKRGIPFTLTPEDIVPLPLACPVLGNWLNYSSRLAQAGIKPRTDKIHRWSSPSLDRIDNDRPYEVGNVIIVSNRVNSIKLDASPAELRIVADFYEKLG